MVLSLFFDKRSFIALLIRTIAALAGNYPILDLFLRLSFLFGSIASLIVLYLFDRGSNVKSILGTGSGLSIVKEYVDLHGGTITVNSGVGIGSTFIVVLPFVPSK